MKKINILAGALCCFLGLAFLPMQSGAATVGLQPKPVRILCKAIGTTNVTRSGTQTFDTIALSVGDTACLVAESDNINGAFIVQSGAWKAIDPGIGTGVELYALNGSSNVNSVYGCDTTGAITWGSTTTVFTKKTATGAAFDPANPGAIGGTTPAAITGTVITATTRMVTPTIGPNGTNQHTLPAVSSGTVLVSGGAPFADATLQLGGVSNRLITIGTQSLNAGLGPLTINTQVTNAGTSVSVPIVSSQNLSAPGASYLSLGGNGGTNPPLYIGSVSGQVDALCYAEQLTANGTVTAGQVVVWSGTKQVSAAAASAGLTTIAGVALTGGTNTTIVVARRGRVYTNADAGITAGQLVKTSGAVAGNVLSPAAAFGTVVGRACEATGATISGQVLVDLTLG